MYVGKQLIMLTSITYAMKGRSILLKHGIAADIERTPKQGEANSCGYSLYVPTRTDEAEKILINNGITVLGRISREVVP
ncbi:MAG TPA: DUF3343 domain-containing protein [Candidatus Scatavimonas merdigallinarum]|uniref:DUF3343 domain-containing protein n=1 Tax=Candidatus Scatavimonas merdigallinarum TaxID=2840914 RepID=A0A9D1CTU3_9FIRM|nr:DUF3343 domain-containing protein [Candidatus Scatavimonas merdigallinarum]